MNLPKKILVPTDFSPCADEALGYALAIAEKLRASVTLMHAYEFAVIGFPDGALITGADVAGRILTDVQAALDAVVAKRKGGRVTLNALLKNGDPRETINPVARDIGADLIILGTHGRRGLARALLGSVAEYVVRTSSCPVLTIGPSRTEAVSSTG